MTPPRRFLVRMVLFVIAIVLVVALLREGLWRAFMASPVLNGVILGVLLIGLVFVFRQVMILGPEVRWIEKYRVGGPGLSAMQPPRLLGPMATLLGERQGRLTLSTVALRSLLDSISARLDESREIARYLIGLLVFLGLLGTFWGLLETVQTVGDVIANLTFTGQDLATAMDGLKAGLRAPLAGMGTAFGSSLLGLSGSLVLGFLDLQAGQAQNRFYNDLEEWLASLTRLQGGGGFASGDGADQPVPAYLQALIEQTADSLENLQRTIARGEENRRLANQHVIQLTERLSILTDQMKAEQQILVKLAEGQAALGPVLHKLADGGGGDEVMRGHVRNIEVYLARMLEEVTSGRGQAVEELRSEIRLLARTIAAVAEGSHR